MDEVKKDETKGQVKIDEPKKSWAGTLPPDREEMDAVKADAERQAGLDSLEVKKLNALIGIGVMLQKIYTEIKRGNDFLIEGRSTQPDAPVEVFSGEGEAVSPQPAVPENLKSEGEIASFYKNTISDVLTEGELERTMIAVEENRVILKIPYLGNPQDPKDTRRFAQVAGRLQNEYGAEYVRDGKNSRFILPKP